MIDGVIDNLVCQLAFSQVKGLQAASAREILNRVGGVDRFFGMSARELVQITGSNSSIFDDEYRQSLISAAVKEAEFVRAHHLSTYFIDDERYPERLANCDDAPILIYAMGNCDLSAAHMIGVVGTRHATAAGIDFASKLVADLATKLDNPVIVSGLAYGIDIAAHRAALKAKVPTVAVLAHPLNTIYPADHRSTAIEIASGGGALLSEYSTANRVHRSNFLERNRIVAGLCDCLVVVESDMRGGSMSTARIASSYNRDVFAMPGRLSDRYSRGTNSLIRRQVAQLITGADDVIDRMGWQASCTEPEQPTLFRPLSADEQQLIDFISEHPEATINDMCVHLSKSYSTISNIIFQLELDDLIMSIPGGRFAVLS